MLRDGVCSGLKNDRVKSAPGGKSPAPKASPKGSPKGVARGKPASGAPTQRQLRVGEEIRHVLSGIFARAEFRDPELAGVLITVTEVRISPDLKNATAFVARLGRSDVDELLPALRRAAPYLRSQLASSMRQQRMIPQLSFQPDEALEYASHIDRLLHTPEVLRDLDKPVVAVGDADEDEGAAEAE